MRNIAKTPQVYGYVRVSMKEQNPDRQLIALGDAGVPAGNIFIDRKSGKDFNRPSYKKLVKKLRGGDLLYICSIDRLGRDYLEIIAEWKHITKAKGADIKVLNMPLLDTTYCKDLLGTFIADLVLQVLSFAAQLERENILQRQAEGIAAAQARGVKFGRGKVVLPERFGEIVCKWRKGELTREDVVALCGFSQRTLYSLTAEVRRAEKVNIGTSPL